MAKRNVVVCDLPKIPGSVSTSPCDKLATSTCAICGRDVCVDHIAFALEARLTTMAPPKLPGQKPPEPILPCVEYMLASKICQECHVFANDVKTRGGQRFGGGPHIPSIDMNPHLATLLESAITEFGAARATVTLTDDAKKENPNGR